MNIENGNYMTLLAHSVTNLSILPETEATGNSREID